MASFLSPKQTVESYATEAIPQSLQSNDSPMALRGKVTQVSIPSATGNQKSNGKLRFVLPNNNNSISRRSMFIRARVSVSFTATLAGLNGNGATAIWFQGPGNNSYVPGAGGGMLPTMTDPNNVLAVGCPVLSNAYSLIQRSTVYCGSSIIDMTNYLCDLMGGLILPHTTNQTWIQNDGQALLGINSLPVKSTNLTTGGFVYWDLAIPITHACFNSQQDFPLYLMSESNPLSIDIDLTSFSRAIAYGVTVQLNPPIQEYTISGAALCYEQIELPREFVEAQRLMTKNTPFVIPQLSYMINQMPISALANYNCSLNISSLRAMYILPYNNSTYTSNHVQTSRSFQYQRNAGDVAISINTGEYSGTNVELFIDNKRVNQIILDTPTMTFVALKQALKNSITDYTSSSNAGSLTAYKYSHFALGIDTTNFSDSSTMMGGTPVGNAQIVLTNFIASGTGAYLANLIFAYDSLLIFKNGKITVKR